MFTLQSVQDFTGLTHHLIFLTFGHSWAPECSNIKKIKKRGLDQYDAKRFGFCYNRKKCGTERVKWWTGKLHAASTIKRENTWGFVSYSFVLSCLDVHVVSNLQLFSRKYIEDYWKLGNWKLGRDKTKLPCLVCSCVHTADADRQECPCRRCEQAVSGAGKDVVAL